MTKSENVKPALITRNEIRWLQGNLQVSKSYQRKIKSDIRSKLRTFQALELPILVKSGFVRDPAATANCNAVTAICNVQNAESNINTHNQARK
jgi:hypothetical protein